MSFSFNPGQQAPTGEPMSGGGLTPPVPQGEPSGAIAVPDSPFLFMQQRGQDMTVGAYVQIILVMVSILAIAVSVTLFAYSTYLTMSIESKKEEMLAKDSTFKEYPIEEMKKLSVRFAALGLILKDYVSVISPLNLLEDVVEKQAVFDKFSLEKDKLNGQHIIAFTVVTNNYKTLIQQLEALHLNQYSKIVPQTKFSNLSYTNSSIKVEVRAPILAQGQLSKNVVFVTSSSTPVKEIISAGSSSKQTLTATTTP